MGADRRRPSHGASSAGVAGAGGNRHWQPWPASNRGRLGSIRQAAAAAPTAGMRAQNGPGSAGFTAAVAGPGPSTGGYPQQAMWCASAGGSAAAPCGSNSGPGLSRHFGDPSARSSPSRTQRLARCVGTGAVRQRRGRRVWHDLVETRTRSVDSETRCWPSRPPLRRMVLGGRGRGLRGRHRRFGRDRRVFHAQCGHQHDGARRHGAGIGRGKSSRGIVAVAARRRRRVRQFKHHRKHRPGEHRRRQVMLGSGSTNTVHGSRSRATLPPKATKATRSLRHQSAANVALDMVAWRGLGRVSGPLGRVRTRTTATHKWTFGGGVDDGR